MQLVFVLDYLDVICRPCAVLYGNRFASRQATRNVISHVTNRYKTSTNVYITVHCALGCNKQISKISFDSLT